MSEKTFDLFCPKCNIMVETTVIAEGHGGFTSRGGAPILDVDSEYYGDAYYVSLCRRCKEPFLICQSRYGIPGEFETIIEENVLYPNESKFDNSEIPSTIKNFYDQGIRSYSAALYEPCVLMCRKCLESICKTYNINKGNLEEKLKNLELIGVIDKRILELSQRIRLIGNDAAHELESLITKEDARDVLDFTELILTYVYTLNLKFEKFVNRREKPQES